MESGGLMPTQQVYARQPKRKGRIDRKRTEMMYFSGAERFREATRNIFLAPLISMVFDDHNFGIWRRAVRRRSIGFLMDGNCDFFFSSSFLFSRKLGQPGNSSTRPASRCAGRGA